MLYGKEDMMYFTPKNWIVKDAQILISFHLLPIINAVFFLSI